MRLMDEANIPAGLQGFYLRTTEDPSARFATEAFREFIGSLDSDKRQRLEGELKRARGQP
jgi:hypothetical protein